MIPKETKGALERFAKRVVKQARTNLTKGKKNVSKELYDSLGYDLNVHKNSFSLFMIMEDYGQFQDLGVKGANPSLVKNGRQKGHLGRFTFRNKMPPLEPLIKWAKFRNIRLRDAKGRFSKGNYRTIGFILQKRIFAQGIKPSLFFTKPFVNAFKDLPEEVVEAFGLDLTDFISHTKTK
mgnify:CR=1 FL=1